MSETGVASSYSHLFFWVRGVRRGFNEREGKEETQTIWESLVQDPHTVIFRLIPGEAVEWTIKVKDRTGNEPVSCRISDPRLGRDRIRLRAFDRSSGFRKDTEFARSLGLDPNDPVFGDNGILRTEWYKGAML